LIRCEVVHVVLPSASKYDIDYEEEEAYEPAILPLASENDAECPPYICLSYTWGDPVDERAIEINGKVLKVRENLWRFLHVASKQFSNLYLWIDALCKFGISIKKLGLFRSELTPFPRIGIDQTNTTERNHQVQQMGNIYTRADSVLI
jgi:hypothetical protein